jgi:hypothetical protein
LEDSEDPTSDVGSEDEDAIQELKESSEQSASEFQIMSDLKSKGRVTNYDDYLEHKAA